MTNHEKILVISDIHGALCGASLMEEALRVQEAQKILCLGDILYHGPRNDVPEDYAPKKVIGIMNRYKDIIIAVRGNCEAEVDQMVLEFPCMADANMLYLFGKKVCMSHGHIYSPANIPSCDVFLYGHTHLPAAEKQNGIVIGNPGSASLPKNGHPRSYGILDENGFRVMTSDHQEYMRVSY
ncbi:MAG: phosphodiesterase [Solobacterium sp.]|nr:phosphodiesterase [Solobacterium sp.]